eukprot:1161078-Pelagomonas_calceolata.AAC.6
MPQRTSTSERATSKRATFAGRVPSCVLCHAVTTFKRATFAGGGKPLPVGRRTFSQGLSVEMLDDRDAVYVFVCCATAVAAQLKVGGSGIAPVPSLPLRAEILSVYAVATGGFVYTVMCRMYNVFGGWDVVYDVQRVARKGLLQRGAVYDELPRS